MATQAENIAKGLVWALPPPWSAIGATLLNLLFPDSSDGIDWTTVFQQFSQIVLDADTETTVDTQDGLLNGVLADINDYVNTKIGQTKTALTIQLEGYLNTTNGIVGVLENSQFAQKGLATFVHAAGIELAILQEMAQQDPAVSDPLQSGHVTTIAQNAAAYATFATNTLNAVLDGLATQRGQQVSGVLHGRHCIYAGHGISDCTTYYYFNDPTANYTSAQYYSAGKHDDPAARCQTDRNNYASQVGAQNRVQKSTEAQWIWNTISWWQKLVNTPLPQQPYSGS
ncbi:MAG: hypothetical protein IPK63_16960 [Candidatus Competibacteraceae bacterium]|nr:hypothetical protein [Candidatus Competibacteraceae bacterium]